MKARTTFELHLSVIQFWNRFGISPLHVVSVENHIHTPEYESNSTEINRLLSFRSLPTSKFKNFHSKATEGISQNINSSVDSSELLNVITSTISNRDVGRRNGEFSVYLMGSFKSATPLFWLMFVFFYTSMIFSVIRLIYVIQNKAAVGLTFLIGSIVWSIYSFTCCTVYIVHFFKSQRLCKLLKEWQIVEGELLNKSKVISKCLPPNYYETYMKWQFKGMLFFILGIPIGITFLGFGATYSSEFPMYIYSVIPSDWKISYWWIKPICFIFTWIQVGYFLFSESQTELVINAFSRSILKGLQTLTEPAKANNENTMINEEELLEVFNDAVYHYTKLNELVVQFNAIFSWPFFIRQALTMVKVCCYTFLLLKHPLENSIAGPVVFSYAVLGIFIKFGLILSTMGKVRIESETFIRSWKAKLVIAFPWRDFCDERRLKCCTPFGFVVGNFYTIYPYTILTFCSVMLTYLILLLQL